MQNHRIHLRDVSCADGEDDITMMGTHHHHLGCGAHVVDAADPIIGRLMFKLHGLVDDRVGADGREILLLFTSREDAGDDHIIGLGQRLGEFTGEKHGTREQMRLEDHMDSGFRIATVG